VFLVWLDELVRNPRILDAVEAILGGNLLVWSPSFFIKEGGDGTHVPWHQDSRAYGARAGRRHRLGGADRQHAGERRAARACPPEKELEREVLYAGVPQPSPVEW
jgi:non-heme Fe2+,alpha-ketoglutarate-dependent halogenase